MQCDVRSLSLVYTVGLDTGFDVFLPSVQTSMRTKSPSTTSQFTRINPPSVDFAGIKFLCSTFSHSSNPSYRLVKPMMGCTSQNASESTQSSPMWPADSCFRNFVVTHARRGLTQRAGSLEQNLHQADELPLRHGRTASLRVHWPRLFELFLAVEFKSFGCCRRMLLIACPSEPRRIQVHSGRFQRSVFVQAQ